MFVDSHCHLTFPELLSDWAHIQEQMQAQQVTRALCICTTLEEFDTVHRFALDNANIWASVGVHPDYEDVQEPTIEGLQLLAGRDKVLAIGETGLDYYRLNGRSVEDMEWQRERFRTHIRVARSTHKPLVIHTRSSAQDTLKLLREEGEDGSSGCAGGVFHCFTEDTSVARAALDAGFYISISGIVTFKNAEALRDVVRMVPMDRLLIETDSPYLAPVPYRGKVNTPALVPYVAQEIARVKDSTIEAVAQATSDNFDRLFVRTP